MRLPVVLLTATVFATSACWRHAEEAPTTGGHEVITRAELERSHELTLYDAILKIRPAFLRNRSFTARGRDAGRQMMVYVDGERLDTIDDLRRLTPSEVEEVRFYEPSQANVVFGRYNNYGGAIAVKMRQQGE
jgi:hypothetical protein